jgi:uncharacterized membrane protein
MEQFNPHALIAIVVAGIGYGIYIGAEALEKRYAKNDQISYVPKFLKHIGGALMVVPIAIFVALWAFAKL